MDLPPLLCRRLSVAGLATWFVACGASSAEPRVLLDGCQLEAVAREPDLVTPVGMACDARGRLLVIESHTHQRPDGYAGPPSDRLRMFADADGDGRPETWTTFADGFKWGGNVVVRPDGGVLLATRNDVRLLEDVDDDGQAEKFTTLLRLETTADYPHNGLGGLAVDAQGTIYVALAENFGADYRLIGSDGSAFAGGAGVGTVFACDADGGNLRRWATGFWNIFGLLQTAEGPLLAIDNDPDACPSSRLVHVVFAGDYGFRYEYGRSGLHPLQAWDGELPGTLPMICGVGEAPTAIVSHRGWAWVTSWGDHRIERYRLNRRGASYGATRETVVQGDESFRPTGMAVGRDGSLYFADWVDKSYPVHGQGRLWRLTLPAAAATDPATVIPPPVEVPAEEAALGGRQDDPFADHQAVVSLAKLSSKTELPAERIMRDALLTDRLALLQAERFRELRGPALFKLLDVALDDREADVRLYAVRWIAESRMRSLREKVAKLLDGEIPSERYYLAVLAAVEWLDGEPAARAATLSDGLLLRELRSRHRSPRVQSLALRMLSPNHPWLTTARLNYWIRGGDADMRREALRTLALQYDNPQRFAILANLAQNDGAPVELRAEAISGLAADAAGQEELLAKLAAGGDSTLAREADRVLRLTGVRAPAEEDDRPPAEDLAAWQELLAEGGDPESGGRLFRMAAGPRCANCHLHEGRGGRVGPELTRIGRTQARARVIASILQPSREVAPAFEPWTLATVDGRMMAGLRLPKPGDDGTELYADVTGARFTLRSADIESRSPSPTSIMPEGLEKTASVEDLRDLVAFLCQQKSGE